MKILLTGANGYIGTRLLPVLLEQGHQVIAFVRRPKNFIILDEHRQQLQIVVGDLLNGKDLEQLPKDIDVAYYLVHSMNDSPNFGDQEKLSAGNFIEFINSTSAKQIIYLSGLTNDANLSA